MNQVIDELQKLIQLKKENIAELFSLQTIQTELEYDLALLRLEFRYDDEADFTLYEAKLNIITSELTDIDSIIAKILVNIDSFSSQISNL